MRNQNPDLTRAYGEQSFNGKKISPAPVPLVKHELVLLSCCAEKRYIEVCIATVRAADWMLKCCCYFEPYSRYMVEHAKSILPCTTIVIVPECYNITEVWHYLMDKPFVHVAGDQNPFRHVK